MRRDRCHWYYLRIAHDRVGSSTDPVLNGHLKYPNNLDQSLNDATADKIRKYRADYNNSQRATYDLTHTRKFISV
jgi:hypothetical protein